MTNFDIQKTHGFSEAAAKGAVMTLKDPGTGEEMSINGAPITITLKGRDAQDVRQVEQDKANARLAKIKTTRKIEITDDDALDVLAAATIAWTGITAEGAEVPCNAGNAKALYKAENWIREQAEDFIADRNNFLAKSKRSS